MAHRYRSLLGGRRQAKRAQYLTKGRIQQWRPNDDKTVFKMVENDRDFRL